MCVRVYIRCLPSAHQLLTAPLRRAHTLTATAEQHNEKFHSAEIKMHLSAMIAFA